MTTRIGIVGYGNLGRGVEYAIDQNSDMELVGVFTRREPHQIELVHERVGVHRYDTLAEHRGAVDVMILCGGSKGDLPEQGPQIAGLFNTVDSFDTHAEIPAYFASVDESAESSGNVALISTGWDPGLFSLNRLLGEAVLPEGATYSFWGKGVSQGHSAAIRKIDGVADAVQYTVPSEESKAVARSGERPQMGSTEMHVRECFVVLADGADRHRVEAEIVGMPHYFADYTTTVHFISAEELAADHSGLPHGGSVIRSGVGAEGSNQMIEFSLHLDSNPAFTASVMVACARAAHRLSEAGETGARTIFDIAPYLLSPLSPDQLRAQLL